MELSNVHAPPTLRPTASNQDLKDRRQKPQGALMSWKTQAIIANYLCFRMILKLYLFLIFISSKPGRAIIYGVLPFSFLTLVEREKKKRG